MAFRTKKRAVWGVSITVGVVLMVGLLGPLVPYKEVRNWVCSVSGSARTEVTWFGLFSHEERTVSPLEEWLRRREPGFGPSWQYTSTQVYYVLAHSCAVGRTPEIYRLKPILGLVVEELSAERIAALVTVLRHGSRDEQTQMIQSIVDEVLERN